MYVTDPLLMCNFPGGNLGEGCGFQDMGMDKGSTLMAAKSVFISFTLRASCEISAHYFFSCYSLHLLLC